MVGPPYVVARYAELRVDPGRVYQFVQDYSPLSGKVLTRYPAVNPLLNDFALLVEYHGVGPPAPTRPRRSPRS